MTQQLSQFRDHRREFGDLLYAYPVISRRAKGLSIGVNLNPDKKCNWDCPYCQVDRTKPGLVESVDEDKLIEELAQITQALGDGSFWDVERFKSTPEEYRVLRDFAFAGDGEPTSYPRFAEVMARLIELKRELGFEQVPITILTNATLFHLPHVKRGLELLKNEPSSIWCKLDAGSQERYERVNVSRFSLEHCLKNIAELGRARPVEIQSMFFEYDGVAPDAAEMDAYVEHLRWLLEQGVTIDRVQVYTIARMPSSSLCVALDNAALDALSARIREALPALNVETFYSAS